VRRRRQTSGFTLAEVVVAMAILAMIGVMMAGTFGQAMDTRDHAERITSRYNMIRAAMLRMSREIQMAFLSEHRWCEEPHTYTIFKTSGGSGGMRLDFTSFSHFKLYADANESDQNELSYFLGRDPDPDPDADANTIHLLRREQSRIDEEPEEGGVVQVLCEDVSSLEFEFYDAKEDRWEDEWDSTDSDYRDRLPMFVTIKLKAKGPGGEEEEFTTKTRVFLRKPLFIVGTGFARCPDA